MADLKFVSKVNTPDGTSYDIKDAHKSGVYPVIGTQTAATNVWTGALHGVNALYDGLTIMYYLPWAGTSTAATLNLTLDNGTSTGAINCYYSTSRLTTHYGKGCNIIMTYHSAGSIKVDGTATTDNRWIANANYADGNSVAYYISNYYNYFVAGPNKIFPYTIVMQNADGRWESIVTSSSAGTSKARNTHGFRLGQLAYLNANATYAENAKVGDNQISYHKSDLIDHRYSFNTANNSTSGTTTKKPVYLVGAINASDGLFYLDATWWTQTLPTTADGKLYIYLGDAFDYYRMSFVIDHPVYWYRNGMIREFAQDAATVNGLTVEKAVPSSAVFTDTTYSMTREGESVKLTPSTGTAQSITLSSLINGLSEGASPASGNDYLVAQYASGGTTTTTYHRRAVKNVVNKTVVDNALGKDSTDTAKFYRHDGTWSPVSESYLSWGGKNFADSYGCIDAAMVDVLSANRLAFAKAAGITIEYTRDGGTTWTDYGATNQQKVGLFSNGYNFVIGKADSSHFPGDDYNYQLRVTLATSAASIYTVLNKFVFLVGTVGSNNCQVKIQKALQSTPDTYIDHTDWIPISGWTGYNVINCGSILTYCNQAATQYGRVRFIFRGKGGTSTNTGLRVSKILGFGGNGWITPSNMATTGHLYSFDADQNATFPAKVTATGGFSGNITGNVTGNCSGTSSNVTGTVAIANGGTGATNASDARTNLGINCTNLGAIPTTAKGTANGVAELDASGKVPASQLPSYVDDVLEYSSKSAFPATGETGKIYVALDTNLTYRWSGTAYVEISPSLALGETSSTAYRGDRGKTAYDHSQSAHARTDATAVSFSRSLTSGTKIGTITINGTGTDLYCQTNTDTKNTAGSTDTSSKIFLIGATSQAANPQTYSQDTAYVGTDGCLYSGGTKVLTAHQDISGKVSKTGDKMSGTLTISTGSASFGEGIRINLSSSGYSTLLLGASSSSTSGTEDGAYWIGTGSASDKKRKLYVAHNGSHQSKTYFYADSSSQQTPNLRVGGDVFITPSNADTGCKMQYNSTTQSLDFIFA